MVTKLLVGFVLLVSPTYAGTCGEVYESQA
jgi:hypothetical protein